MLFPNANQYDPASCRLFMSGRVKDGERIPRRPLPKFEEANSLASGLTRDGLITTAMNDTNEYGPHSMMILLLITATLTGGMLLAFRYI